MPKVLICGLGNPLKLDDGIGPSVITELEKHELPEDVDTADFGISGFKCALGIADYDKVVFVDAIQMGKEPGKIYRIALTEQELLESPSLNSFTFSLHESDLEMILATAALLGSYPKEVVIIGCEPKSSGYGVGMSEEVEQARDEIIEYVLREIN